MKWFEATIKSILKYNKVVPEERTARQSIGTGQIMVT